VRARKKRGERGKKTQMGVRSHIGRVIDFKFVGTSIVFVVCSEYLFDYVLFLWFYNFKIKKKYTKRRSIRHCYCHEISHIGSI